MPRERLSDEERKARHRERSRAWREANPERAREQNRAWREANLERKREQDRAWREANRERLRERSRAWREANPERKREQDRAWREANPERVWRRNRAWREVNPERDRERKRAWYEANRERDKEQNRAWREANPERRRELSRQSQRTRRAIKAGAIDTCLPNVSLAAINRRFWLFRNACAYCGSHDSLHLDHVNPLARGGLHTPRNLVPACERCNLSKGAKPVEAWYLSQPFFSPERWKALQTHTSRQWSTVEQLTLLSLL